MSDFISDWMWIFFVVVVLLPRVLRFLFRSKTQPAVPTRPPQPSWPREVGAPPMPVQTSREAESFNPRSGQPPPIVPR